MKTSIRAKMLAGMGVAVMVAAAALATTTPSNAAGPREKLREGFDKALKGKTVAWSPVWLGVLESEWTRVMKSRFDDYGI